MPKLAVSASPVTPDVKASHQADSLPKAAPRGILLIEPDISLLSAETILLTDTSYCVTPAFSQRELFILRGTKPVALAIISDSFGRHLLPAVAETVRRQWPLARILIVGRAATLLEDHLYDEQIERSLEPKQLLDDLERLYKNLWNQRSGRLDWNGGCAAKGLGSSGD